MKILKRLLPFARPIHHFLPEYLVYTFLGILFGLLNFALLIPVLRLLFEKTPAVIRSRPEFEMSLSYFKDLFDYHLFDIMQTNGKFQALLFVCIIILVSIIFSNIFRYMAVRVLLRLRLKIMAGLRGQLYKKYLQQSLRYHHNHNKGGLVFTLTNEVQEIEGSVVTPLQIILRDPFVVIAYFGLLFYWDYKLTLFTLIFLPATGFIISRLTRKLKKMNYFSQEVISQFYSTTEESISGVRQIQSYTAENFMEKKFRELIHVFTQHSKLLSGKKEQATPISEILGVAAALSLVVFGGYLILNNETDLTGEGFIAYLALYTQVIQPLKNLSQTSIILQRGIVATEKIFGVLDAPVEIKDDNEAISKNNFNQSIEIKNISFSYDGSQSILKNINLSIQKGKIIALVGQSGGGKTTLTDLVCRFYDVEEGIIEIDGTDIRKVKVRDLRSLLGTVSQDAFLFNDTVYNNIALGKENATQEEVEYAATVANAHEFITNMPGGYATVVGERGVKLSGGQRQRITIARAILKNPPILILDEATSALDTESERLVQDAINKMMTNRTTLVIAHRLSTVRHADEIVVLQKGEIAERGTHEYLLAKGGIYKKLVDLQEVK